MNKARSVSKIMKATALRVIFGLFLLSPGVYAGLVGWRSLVDLERNSDLIVVGSASAGSQAGPVVSFTVHVGRVVKGDPAIAGSLIPVAWTNAAGSPDTMAGGSSVVTGNGLWFLQRSSSGWTLLPVMQGSVPLSETFIPVPTGSIPDAYGYGSATPLSDRVASEVSAAIEGTDGGADKFYELHIALLDQLDSAVIRVLYHRMATSNSPRQKILGLSGLIRSGSADALSSAVQSMSLFENYPLESGVLQAAIRESFRAADPTPVAVLGQATAKNIPLVFREAAAHALASIHTVAALPYLAALLDDPEPNLRVDAIGGLSAFANGLPVQSASDVANLRYLQLPENAPYKTPDTIANYAMGKQAISRNEAMYLSFWSSWWQQHRSELGY